MGVLDFLQNIGNGNNSNGVSAENAITAQPQFNLDSGSLSGFGSGNSPVAGNDIFGGLQLPSFDTGGGFGSEIPGLDGAGLDANSGGIFGGLFEGDSLSNIGSLLQGIQGLGQAYTGYKQLGLQEDLLDFQKDSFNANFKASADQYNTSTEDRQRARIGGTGDNNAAGNYESVDQYVKDNSISTKKIG